MKRHGFLGCLFVGMVLLFFICVVTCNVQAQFYNPFYNPFFPGANPYFVPFPQMAFGFYPPPLYPATIFSPYASAPILVPPARVGAATLIITNPTAGTATVSVINPTVVGAPATAVPPAPTPLLSALAILYSSALYNSPLTTANPLLNAVLSTIFI